MTPSQRYAIGDRVYCAADLFNDGGLPEELSHVAG